MFQPSGDKKLVMFVGIQPADALEDAVYFLKALQQLSIKRVETHILAYRIYMRKGILH